MILALACPSQTEKISSMLLKLLGVVSLFYLLTHASEFLTGSLSVICEGTL